MLWGDPSLSSKAGWALWTSLLSEYLLWTYKIVNCSSPHPVDVSWTERL